MSLNKVSLIGNLGRDPEVRTTQAGSKVVSLAVATTEKWTDKNTQQRQEKTEWHRVVIFNDRLGGLAEQYLQKGSQVYLEGQLSTRKYTDKEGVERNVTEVVLKQFNGEMKFLGGGSKRAPQAGTTYEGNPDTGEVTRTDPNGSKQVLDGDNIPF